MFFTTSAGNLRGVTYRVKIPTSDNLIFEALPSIDTNVDNLVQSPAGEGACPLQPQHDLPADESEENDCELMDTK